MSLLAIDSGVQRTLSSQHVAHPYTNDILGVAIFDINGLPREYFTTPENTGMNWVQTVFQSLGLKSLLMSSLQVEGFRHAIIRTASHCAIVVKQKDHYIALLIRDLNPSFSLPKQDGFMEWIQDFEANALRSDPRFCVM